MRRRAVLLAALVGTFGTTAGCSDTTRPGSGSAAGPGARVPLSVALANRRSVREYAEDPLTQAEIDRLMWAAQGISSREGLRTAPSAGALYPLTVYVALRDGVYRYEPAGNRTSRLWSADLRVPLGTAALGQVWLSRAPAVFVISGDASRTAVKYGARAERYVLMEAGHAAQNLLLQAVALGLAATPVGAFEDQELTRLLRLSGDERPIYLLPVGRPRH